MLVAVMACGEAATPEQFTGLHRLLQIDNTGVTTCTLDEAGQWRILTLNDSAHLETNGQDRELARE